MAAKEDLVDSVFVKGGEVQVKLDNFYQLPDTVSVWVWPDTLLVDIVTGEGCDPIFGWSWDGWQGTGSWFGPIAVFFLALYFEKRGRQKAKQRDQTAQVAHFVGWRTHVIAQIKEQIDRLNNFVQAIEIQETSQMPADSLLRFQLDFDLWLQLTPAEMTRVFVLNKQGSKEKNREDLQVVLSSARDIREDFDAAKDAVQLLYEEYVQFVEEWNERYRTVTDLFLSTIDPQFILSSQLNGEILSEMHAQYVTMPLRLLDRQALLGDLVQQLTRLYLETRKRPYHELGIQITRLKATIDKIIPLENQADLMIQSLRRNIKIRFLDLSKASEQLAQLPDRPYMKLV